MIYTVGNEQMYLSAMKNGKLVKNARSEKFPSAKVFETVDAARAHLEPEFAVFGVEADWSSTSSLNPEADWRHLTVDADVVKVPGERYFTNRTPFKVGMPADHALKIIKRTYRRTKKQPEEIKEDDKGKVVKWFLTDCTLILRRMQVPGPYVVTGIKGKENGVGSKE